MKNPAAIAIPESWLTVEGYEGCYEISDLGRVRSLPRVTARGWHLQGRVLKPQVHKVSGHMEVSLYGQVKNGRSYWIHQLAARAFLGPCPDGQEVRHLDGNPANNTVGNLTYGTRKENLADARSHGTLWQSTPWTRCLRGHELTPENTYLKSAGGSRTCRTCALERAHAQQLARREDIPYQEALSVIRSTAEAA